MDGGRRGGGEAKSAMVCMVFMLAAVHDLELDQMDVRAAYLNAEIGVPIYMKQPKGYEKGDLVCKLNKALYGIKQAGRVWAAKLKGLLEECGFTASVQWKSKKAQTTATSITIANLEAIYHCATECK
jgi:hypothetical protein